MLLPFGDVVSEVSDEFQRGQTEDMLGRNASVLFISTGHIGISQIGVRFPKPIGGGLGKILKPLFAFPERLHHQFTLGDIVPDRLIFEHIPGAIQQYSIGPTLPADLTIRQNNLVLHSSMGIARIKGLHVLLRRLAVRFRNKLKKIKALKILDCLSEIIGVSTIDVGQSAIGLKPTNQIRKILDQLPISMFTAMRPFDSGLVTMNFTVKHR